MTGKDIFRIWAPAGKLWVDWVHPVPFVGLDYVSEPYYVSNFKIPKINFLNEISQQGAIIVDLLGTDSVRVGIALTQMGYRPIPVFNGTMEQPGAKATVDNQSVGIALLWGASILQHTQIPEEALPAFLLDRNRLNRYKMKGSMFDNSWDIYAQDLPSADYFKNHGIYNIIIVSNSIGKDLKKILYGFQKQGLSMYLTNGYEPPKKVRIFNNWI